MVTKTSLELEDIDPKTECLITSLLYQKKDILSGVNCNCKKLSKMKIDDEKIESHCLLNELVKLLGKNLLIL